MKQELNRVERSVKERLFVDKTLMNYWLYFFLLNGLTSGILGIILYFQKIIRIDKFYLRKKEYYEGIINYTEKYAQENGKYDEVKGELESLRNHYNVNFVNGINEIDLLKALLLPWVTFGIWAIVVQYKMNKSWNVFQIFEQKFDSQLSDIWIKLDLIKHPINFQTDPALKRNFWIQYLLIFVTLGIWFIVWDYKMHTDPDRIYKEFHTVEDFVLQTIKQ